MTGVLNESHGAAGCKVAIGSLFIECNHLGGVATTIDFFERSELCYDADVLSQRNGTMGGMLAAIESGFVQKEIQEAAYRYQRAVETGERIVVGVNQYQSDVMDQQLEGQNIW